MSIIEETANRKHTYYAKTSKLCKITDEFPDDRIVEALRPHFKFKSVPENFAKSKSWWAQGAFRSDEMIVHPVWFDIIKLDYIYGNCIVSESILALSSRQQRLRVRTHVNASDTLFKNALIVNGLVIGLWRAHTNTGTISFADSVTLREANEWIFEYGMDPAENKEHIDVFERYLKP